MSGRFRGRAKLRHYKMASSWKIGRICLPLGALESKLLLSRILLSCLAFFRNQQCYLVTKEAWGIAVGVRMLRECQYAHELYDDLALFRVTSTRQIILVHDDKWKHSRLIQLSAQKFWQHSNFWNFLFQCAFRIHPGEIHLEPEPVFHYVCLQTWTNYGISQSSNEKCCIRCIALHTPTTHDVYFCGGLRLVNRDINKFYRSNSIYIRLIRALLSGLQHRQFSQHVSLKVAHNNTINTYSAKYPNESHFAP